MIKMVGYSKRIPPFGIKTIRNYDPSKYRAARHYDISILRYQPGHMILIICGMLSLKACRIPIMGYDSMTILHFIKLALKASK